MLVYPVNLVNVWFYVGLCNLIIHLCYCNSFIVDQVLT